MNRDEWEIISGGLEHCFKGEWSDAKQEAYFRLLQNYDAPLVAAAIETCADDGMVFTPAAAEIIAAMRSVATPKVPDWPTAWAGIRKAMTKKSHYGRVVALRWAQENLHYTVFGFIVAEGIEELSMTGFYDPEYGPIRLRDLERRWNDYVEGEDARISRGLAIERRAGRRIGPQQISEIVAAAVGSPPAQLEAGPE